MKGNTVIDKTKQYWIITSVIFIIFSSSFCSSNVIEEIQPFTKDDRVLVFAPHPDDEAIGVAGVIQKAIKEGAKVKIVCYTNGDFNEASYVLSSFSIPPIYFLGQSDMIKFGEKRQKETIKAMDFLGIKRDDIIFLGYPDFSTMRILLEYWGKTKPCRSTWLWISRVPYKDVLSYNAPYVGESILRDITAVLLDYKPTKIFVTNGADTNVDHRSLYLFLRIALWDVEGRIKAPLVIPYIIHVENWPMPRGYHPELELNPPENLKGIAWQKLLLKEEEVNTKNEVISFYRSQIAPNPPYLFSFARRNELFGDYPVVNIKKKKEDDLSWQYLNVAGNTKDEAVLKTKREKVIDIISNLAYAASYDNLFIKFNIKQEKRGGAGISIYLLGYKKGKAFSEMPKINVYLNIPKSIISIKDKKTEMFVKDASFNSKGEEGVIKLPLSVLGNPDYILCCAKSTVISGITYMEIVGLFCFILALISIFFTFRLKKYIY